jgi:hypothetical protein
MQSDHGVSVLAHPPTRRIRRAGAGAASGHVGTWCAPARTARVPVGAPPPGARAGRPTAGKPISIIYSSGQLRFLLADLPARGQVNQGSRRSSPEYKPGANLLAAR